MNTSLLFNFTVKPAQLPKFSALLLLLLAGLSGLQAQLTIDNFSASQAFIFAVGAGNTQSSVIDDPGILGGERDIFIKVISGSLVSAEVTAGTFSFSNSASTTGTLLISWDGNDNLPNDTDIDYTGLGGYDLTAVGNAISITINSADIPGSFTLEVFTDASNSSTYTQAFPAINSATTYTITYSSFSTNLGTGADFTNVGAITLSSTGTSLDLVADIFESIFPVEWLGFEARNSGDQVVLDWSTASESNNQGFEIERSQTAREWESIGFVDGKGNSSEVSAYTFADEVKEAGMYFYRLKQIDYDGEAHYSKIVGVQVEEKELSANIRAYPNPFNDRIYIEHAAASTARLYDASGKQLLQRVLPPASRGELPTAHLPAGYYLLEVMSPQRGRFVQKLIK